MFFISQCMIYFYKCLFCLLLLNDSVKSHRVRRIVNGDIVETGKYPIVVSIRSGDGLTHMCGGTLVTQHYVVTAAHCIQQSFGKNNVDQYIIRFQNLVPPGNNSLDNDDIKNLNVGVQKIYIHDQYTNYTNNHDIALMKLNTTIDTFDSFFEKIFPQTSFGLTGECDIFGYGRTSYFSEDDNGDTLRIGKVSIISMLECEVSLMEFIAPKPGDGMFCATGDTSDACLGDSGSPMMCSGVLEGIISYGMGCKGSAGVYTRVAEHMDWLNTIISEDY